MRYETFRKSFRNRPFFKPEDLYASRPPLPHEFVQLSLWVRQGKLVRLRKGLYTLPDDERAAVLDQAVLANSLYEPSYVSLEFALFVYGLVPDAVGTVTSVSTRKTKQFITPLGRFQYRNLKPVDFHGFVEHKTSSGQSYWLATPEKAVIDFLHLCVDRSAKPSVNLFEEGYRFQNLEVLNKETFLRTVERCSNARTRRWGTVFIHMLA